MIKVAAATPIPIHPRLIQPLDNFMPLTLLYP
jgi:hypothetical protein